LIISNFKTYQKYFSCFSVLFEQTKELVQVIARTDLFFFSKIDNIYYLFIYIFYIKQP